jgi:hypothetical protein
MGPDVPCGGVRYDGDRSRRNGTYGHLPATCAAEVRAYRREGGGVDGYAWTACRPRGQGRGGWVETSGSLLSRLEQRTHNPWVVGSGPSRPFALILRAVGGLVRPDRLSGSSPSACGRRPLGIVRPSVEGAGISTPRRQVPGEAAESGTVAVAVARGDRPTRPQSRPHEKWGGTTRLRLACGRPRRRTRSAMPSWIAAFASATRR